MTLSLPSVLHADSRPLMPPSAAASVAVLALAAPPVPPLLLGGAGAPQPVSTSSVATARLAAVAMGFLRNVTSGVGRRRSGGVTVPCWYVSRGRRHCGPLPGA